MIETLHHVVIIIFGFLGIAAVLLFIALTIILYRKISPMLDTARDVITELRGTSAFVSETIVRPLIRAASLATGLKKTLALLSRLSGGERGKKGGRG